MNAPAQPSASDTIMAELRAVDAAKAAGAGDG